MPDAIPEPRLIRRYPNRKLYDVRTSAYVTLDDLARIVRAGEELRVVDTASGDDITPQTLTQVILEEGRRGPSLLPSELLHAALRRGGRALDAGRDAVGGAVGSAAERLRHGVDDLVHQSVETLSGTLARVLPGPRAEELDALRAQLARVEQTLAELVARQAPAPGAEPAAGAAPNVPPPSSPDQASTI